MDGGCVRGGYFRANKTWELRPIVQGCHNGVNTDPQISSKIYFFIKRINHYGPNVFIKLCKHFFFYNQVISQNLVVTGLLEIYGTIETNKIIGGSGGINYRFQGSIRSKRFSWCAKKNFSRLRRGGRGGGTPTGENHCDRSPPFRFFSTSYLVSHLFFGILNSRTFDYTNHEIYSIYTHELPRIQSCLKVAVA